MPIDPLLLKNYFQAVMLKQVVSSPLFIRRWSISQALLSFHFNSFVPGNFAEKRLLKLFKPLSGHKDGLAVKSQNCP